MNILKIAWTGIKRDFRDIRTLVFMLAFPIVLMLILGSALSAAFTNTISVDDIHVLYKDTGASEFTPYFNSFTKEASKSGIYFKKAANEVDGKNEVEEGNYQGYVEITDKGLQLYTNDRTSIEANVIGGMLSAFVDKYNVLFEVVKVDSNQVGHVLGASQDDYIQQSSLHSAKQPGSMDYYAVAMTTMIALYAAMGASYLLRGERLRKTADRLLAAPVSKAEIFLGKIFGSIVLNFLCVLIVVVFSKFVFKANWGEHLGLVLVILLTEVFLAISFGLGVSYITKTGAASKMIVMIVVQISSMIGGAYYKLSDTSGIASLSPLTWANTAITKIIYTNDLAAAVPVITLNICLAALFLLITIVSLQRREGL